MKNFIKMIPMFVIVFLAVIAMFIVKSVTDSYIWGIAALIITVFVVGIIFRVVLFFIKKRKRRQNSEHYED